jgi:6-phosphofructokinase 1
MQKIAILTSGGDAPGMNCAIRSVVRYADHKGVQVIGIYKGYQGLIDKAFQKMGRRDVSNIISRGGTILKTARSEEFKTKEGRKKAIDNLLEEKIEGLIVIGGNGSFRGALALHEECNYPVVGIPGTIDNDINGTQKTLGFDTALNTAMDAIDKVKDTATSMDRVFLIEVMGRKSGAIAVYAALAGGAEDILVPGKLQKIDDLVEKIEQGRESEKRSWIIIVAEGAYFAEDLVKKFKDHDTDVRATVIGHLQRGGSPSAFDRYLGAMLGKGAVDELFLGKKHHVIGWVNDSTIVYPLQIAVKPKEEYFSDLVELIQILT